jgi:hypothetical protein
MPSLPYILIFFGFLSSAVLIWSGVRIYQRSKVTKYYSAKLLALGLILFGIFPIFGVLRHIVVQWELYQLDEIFYRATVFFGSFGIFLLLLFILKSFIPRRFNLIFILILLVSFSIIWMGNFFLPLKMIETPVSPFLEPWPAKQTVYIFEWAPANFIWTFGGLFFGLITVSIFLYNGIRSKNKKIFRKSFIYGTGLALLIFPILFCHISLTVAFILFGIGSLLIYKAFGMEI